MLGIGGLIKSLRLEKGISVSKLCENICSERFLYMIENKNRIPSAYIISQFGNRLELNIYDYLEFIGFKKPIEAKLYLEKSHEHRLARAYMVLEQLNTEMKAFEDCELSPIKFEIISNHHIY